MSEARIKPTTSWFLVGFVSAEPQQELQEEILKVTREKQCVPYNGNPIKLAYFSEKVVRHIQSSERKKKSQPGILQLAKL